MRIYKRPYLIFIIFFVFYSIIAPAGCSSMKKAPLKPEKKLPHARPLRGLYVPVKYYNSKDYFSDTLNKGKSAGINMLVIDIHRYDMNPLIDREVILFLKKEKIYTAARIVCFPDGLHRLPVPESRLEKIYSLIRHAADAGFNEAQLDYIRFRDSAGIYDLKKKYRFIEELLGKMRKISKEKSIKLSADLFGRVVFNHDDNIGQKLEVFARYTDVVYPMLYPSHFIDSTYRMSHPGETVKDGVMRGLKRLKGTGVEIHPYIQSFRYNIQWARVSLEKYVKLQVDAVESSGARGWVAWNAAGEYSAVFGALGDKTGR